MARTPAPLPCGARRRPGSDCRTTLKAPLVLLALAAMASAAAASQAANVDARAVAAIVAAPSPSSPQPLPPIIVMLGYQEGARRRARCVLPSARPSSTPETPQLPHLRGLDLHFLPAMGGGGGAYADPFLAGVAPRCSSGLARVEHDPPGSQPRQDARVVFGQDLRARSQAAEAAGLSGGGGAVVRTALCPPGTGVSGVAWRPARPSGDAKEEKQPLRVAGVTVFCRPLGEGEEEGEDDVAVVVDPAPEASSPPPHGARRPRLACPAAVAGVGSGDRRTGRVVSELEIWHDDVFNGFSVVGCSS